MRRPIVVGVAGGVGTSTVALALGGEDLGIYRAGDDVDVVVCRSTASSMELAHAVVNDMHIRAAVVLVMVADSPGRPPSVVRSMLRMVEPHLHAAVTVPWVPSWRQERQPLNQAAQALRGGHRSLSGFRRAMESVAEKTERIERRSPPRRTGPDYDDYDHDHDRRWVEDDRDGVEEYYAERASSTDGARFDDRAPLRDEPEHRPARTPPVADSERWDDLPGRDVEDHPDSTVVAFPARADRATAQAGPGPSHPWEDQRVPRPGSPANRWVPQRAPEPDRTQEVRPPSRTPEPASQPPPAVGVGPEPRGSWATAPSATPSAGPAGPPLAGLPKAARAADPDETQIVPPRTSERRTSW